MLCYPRGTQGWSDSVEPRDPTCHVRKERGGEETRGEPFSKGAVAAAASRPVPNVITYSAMISLREEASSKSSALEESRTIAVGKMWCEK